MLHTAAPAESKAVTGKGANACILGITNTRAEDPAPRSSESTDNKGVSHYVLTHS